jgi:hypothetical protein
MVSSLELPQPFLTLQELTLSIFALAFGFPVFLVPVDRDSADFIEGTGTDGSIEDVPENYAPSPSSASQYLSPGFLDSSLDHPRALQPVTLDSGPQEHAEGHFSVGYHPPLTLQELSEHSNLAADSTRTGWPFPPLDILKTQSREEMWSLVIVDYSPSHIIASDQQTVLCKSVAGTSEDSETEGTATSSVPVPSLVSDVPPDLSNIEEHIPRIHFRHKPGSWEYVAQSQVGSRHSLQWLVMKGQGDLRKSWESERPRNPPVDHDLQNFRFTFAQIISVTDGTMFERGRVETVDIELIVPRNDATKEERGHFCQNLAKALTTNPFMERFFERHSRYIDSWEQGVLIQALVQCPLAEIAAPKAPEEYQRYKTFNGRWR